jgi:hypothetical protein
VILTVAHKHSPHAVGGNGECLAVNESRSGIDRRRNQASIVTCRPPRKKRRRQLPSGPDVPIRTWSTTCGLPAQSLDNAATSRCANSIVDFESWGLTAARALFSKSSRLPRCYLTPCNLIAVGQSACVISVTSVDLLLSISGLQHANKSAMA